MCDLTDSISLSSFVGVYVTSDSQTNSPLTIHNSTNSSPSLYPSSLFKECIDVKFSFKMKKIIRLYREK